MIAASGAASASPPRRFRPAFVQYRQAAARAPPPRPARRGSPQDRAGRRARARAATASAPDPAPPQAATRTSARAARVGDEQRDRIEPPADRGRIGERRRKPLASSRAPADRHGAVDRVAERAAPLARERAHQFEIGARRRIDRQRRAGRLARRRRERRALARAACAPHR